MNYFIRKFSTLKIRFGEKSPLWKSQRSVSSVGQDIFYCLNARRTLIYEILFCELQMRVASQIRAASREDGRKKIVGAAINPFSAKCESDSNSNRERQFLIAKTKSNLQNKVRKKYIRIPRNENVMWKIAILFPEKLWIFHRNFPSVSISSSNDI